MSEATFYSRLGAVAKLCCFDIDAEIVKLYDSALAPIGYDRLVRALDALAYDLRPGMPFPSIAAIRKQATGELGVVDQRIADDSEARTAASLIVGAVRRFGEINGTGQSAQDKTAKIRAMIGELAWDAVQARGGWNVICETLTNDHVPIFEAQMRELLKARLDRCRRGVDDLPPGLPMPGPRSGGLKAVSANDIANALPESIRSRLTSEGSK